MSPKAACLPLELVFDDSSLHASGSKDVKLYRKEPYAYRNQLQRFLRLYGCPDDLCVSGQTPCSGSGTLN